MQRYTAVLVMFLRIYETLEARVSDVLTWTELGVALEWDQRRKLAALRRDIALLGTSAISDNNGQPASPTIISHADALGVLYVTEGATLGGQYIAPHIKQLLHTEAVNFFDAYGPQRALRWQQYRKILRQYTATNADVVPRIQQAAVETFDVFLDAYRRDFISPPAVTT